MLGDVLLRRHARIPPDERIVRFLVIAPERRELARHKLESSPILREAMRPGTGTSSGRISAPGWQRERRSRSRTWSRTSGSSPRWSGAEQLGAVRLTSRRCNREATRLT